MKHVKAVLFSERSVIDHPNRAFSDVHSSLLELRRLNLQLGVVGRHRSHGDIVMALNGCHHLISQIVGSAENEGKALAEVCGRLRLPTKEVIYVSDSETEISAARVAGAIPVGIVRGHGGDPQDQAVHDASIVLSRAGASVVVLSFVEFLTWIRLHRL